MAIFRVMRSVLLATGACLIAACASQPAARGSLDDRYFQREAKNYLAFQHEGQTVYCVTKDSNASLIPYTGTVRCVSEARLRQVVENARRGRNPVMYTKW